MTGVGAVTVPPADDVVDPDAVDGTPEEGTDAVDGPAVVAPLVEPTNAY